MILHGYWKLVVGHFVALARIQALVIEVRRTYLSGIGKDTTVS